MLMERIVQKTELTPTVHNAIYFLLYFVASCFVFLMQVTTHQIYVTALMGYIAKFPNPEQWDGANGPSLHPDMGRVQVLVTYQAGRSPRDLKPCLPASQSAVPCLHNSKVMNQFTLCVDSYNHPLISPVPFCGAETEAHGVGSIPCHFWVF